MNPELLALLIFVPLFTAEIVVLDHYNHKSGIVITNNGDSIVCTLKGTPGNNVYYKSVKDSAYKAVSIDNIKEYRYTKSHITYHALIIPGGITPRYLRLIDTGKIELYAFYEYIGKSLNTHLFVVKETQAMVKIYGYNAGINNEEVLKTMIADSQPALNYLNGQKYYTPKVAENAVEIYNGTKSDLASVNKSQ